LGVDFYVINGSDEGRFLDTVRNNAKNFASTVSLSSDAKHKVVIIDEADNTGNDVQLLLRAFIEEFAGNCRFIFTCNYKNKIIEPLHSRCAVVEFGIRGKEKTQLAGSFFKRLQDILDAEGVRYDPKVLAELISKHFPDWRRVLNECQRYSVGGEIDSGILASFSDVAVNDLITHLKDKTFLKSESGWLPIWTTILLSFFAGFTTPVILIFHPKLYLLPFLLLLSINIRLHLLLTKKLTS
jgi:DNA polymerase III delta prime subunit